MHERAAVAPVKSSAPINVVAKDGNTPLHSAAAGGSEPIVKLLLRHGADVQSYNKEGRTPLHRAAQFGHPETVRALIYAGACVNALGPTTGPHYTWLRLLARDTSRRLEAFRWLTLSEQSRF